MATIQMNSNTGVTGTLTLPAPSGAQVSVTNGVGSVNAVDVPVAQAAGWSILPGQNWPALRLVSMTIPPAANGASWPSTGNVTLPDGSTLAIASGVAQVPAWAVNYLTQFGWSRN